MSTFRLMSLAACCALLWGCGSNASEPAPAPVLAEPVAVEAAPAAAPAPDASVLPLVTVHKSPTCGCCTAWQMNIQAAGHPVAVVEQDDLAPLKRALGVPSGMASCHTAMVGEYFIEGHVPAEDVARLLQERPDARGLAVPGMPVGSPGMESPSGFVQPYTVYLINRDGSSTPFSQHGR